MAYDPLNSQSQSPSFTAGSGIVDAGLQSYMRSVYNTMGGGLVITGLTSFVTANTPTLFNAIFHSPLGIVVMLAPLAFVWFGFSPARIANSSLASLQLMFSIFSIVMGLSLSAIFAIYSPDSIARVFFITAGMFAATSLYGYTTKRDLAGIGSFMFMGLIGIIIASVVNLFLHSTMIQFVVSFAGVAIFTGLTAWETQSLKVSYRSGAADANSRMAFAGALGLYLNFINMFQFLLRIMGDRR